MMNESLVEALAGSGLCRNMDQGELRSVMEHGELLEASVGSTLIDEGKHNAGIMILLDGTVDVTRDDGSGSNVHLATLHEGALFGERSLLCDQPPIATVRVTKPVRYFYLTRPAYERLAADQPRAACKMSMAIARVETQRLEQMNQKVIELMRAQGQGESIAELDRFREKLLTEWRF